MEEWPWRGRCNLDSSPFWDILTTNGSKSARTTMRRTLKVWPYACPEQSQFSESYNPDWWPDSERRERGRWSYFSSKYVRVQVPFWGLVPTDPETRQLGVAISGSETKTLLARWVGMKETTTKQWKMKVKKSRQKLRHFTPKKGRSVKVKYVCILEP